jgi:hypothetical protein
MANLILELSGNDSERQQFSLRGSPVKSNNFLRTAVFLSGFLALLDKGIANETYALTLTNGSNMPLAAGVVYAIAGQRGTSNIGDAPTPGFVKLCQMGNPTEKFSELKANPNVKWVAETPGPILPGATITVSVNIPNPKGDSLHFEGMYGESKELCASISIGSHDLKWLSYGEQISNTDHVISAGAASEPALANNLNNANLCVGDKAAIDCLRTLTSTKSSGAQIHSFEGYLPSVINFLESKYGSDDVLTLSVPQGGAINYSLRKQ